jgi:cobalt/nickel transport protein
MKMSQLSAIIFSVLPAAPAFAHEYWLSPLNYQVESGEKIAAHFRNGEEFVGATFPYLPNRLSRFEIVVEGQAFNLSPRAGDNPALQIPAPGRDALVVVVAETTPSKVTYEEWEKFLSFAEHKDFPKAEADHSANGWSQEKIVESYTRHVKALIATGSGAGQDAPTGMTTEFVALTNPYDADFEDQMKVALFYQDEPRVAAQIEVFDRAPDDSVTISLHRTNAAGEAVIPVIAGHEYLFDAVVLRPAAEAKTGAEYNPDQPVWETLWAALTFAVPQ